MKIAPIMLNYGKNNAISTRGQSVFQQKAPMVRKYSGNACQDLAYASMFDKKNCSRFKINGINLVNETCCFRLRLLGVGSDKASDAKV